MRFFFFSFIFNDLVSTDTWFFISSQSDVWIVSFSLMPWWYWDLFPFSLPPLRDLVTSQRAVTITTTPSRNFFSTFLTQGRRTPGKTQQMNCGSSPSQAVVGRKEPTTNPVRATSFVPFLLGRLTHIVNNQELNWTLPALYIMGYMLVDCWVHPQYCENIPNFFPALFVYHLVLCSQENQYSSKRWSQFARYQLANLQPPRHNRWQSKLHLWGRKDSRTMRKKGRSSSPNHHHRSLKV